MPWPIDYVHGTYLRYLTFPVSASTRSQTPSGGTRNTVSSPDKRSLVVGVTLPGSWTWMTSRGSLTSSPPMQRRMPSSCPAESPPTNTTTSYQDAMSESEHRCVAASTFRNLWLQLLPRIVCSRPVTDLCWECQRNNRDISTSSNLPEVVKQAKLKKQQAHLDLVFMERTFYQNMVKDTKAAYTAAGCPPLGPHPPCSTDFAVHLSFDYAQQVHLPSFPMQPGPLYFLVPRKVGIFGVCMEGIPWQVNYLIDESHCSSKGSNAVISTPSLPPTGVLAC